MSDLEQENTRLKLEIKEVKKENKELKNKLKKYSNPDRNKKYYKNNKEKCIRKSNERLKNLPKEKLKKPPWTPPNYVFGIVWPLCQYHFILY